MSCHQECVCFGPQFCPHYNHKVDAAIQERCASSQEWRNQYCAFFKKFMEIKSQKVAEQMQEQQEELDTSTATIHAAIEELQAQGVDDPNQLHSMEGAGDLVAEVLKKVGVTPEKLSSWLGKECGCNARQKFLNKILPFTKKT